MAVIDLNGDLAGDPGGDPSEGFGPRRHPIA